MNKSNKNETCPCPHPESAKKKDKWKNTYNSLELMKTRGEEFASLKLANLEPPKRKCIVKRSTTFFFEIFNKQDFKCPILVPPTVLVLNGVIVNWYFTSQKTGVVIKKNQKH